jgi:hypothetical protein
MDKRKPPPPFRMPYDIEGFDPVPPVSPVFRGIVVAVLAMLILFCLIGFAATAITLTMLVLP